MSCMQVHRGFGKFRCADPSTFQDLSSIVALSKDYVTTEPMLVTADNAPPPLLRPANRCLPACLHCTAPRACVLGRVFAAPADLTGREGWVRQEEIAAEIYILQVGVHVGAEVQRCRGAV